MGPQRLASLTPVRPDRTWGIYMGDIHAGYTSGIYRGDIKVRAGRFDALRAKVIQG
jgi:hypothetical protein